MEIVKELSDISLHITEPEYRQRPELSYSTLSTYETLGFNGLDHLFDKKESTSLTLGSAVDAIITGGEDEFQSHFLVVDIPVSSGKEIQITNYLLDNYRQVFQTLEEIPEDVILEASALFNYGADNWRPETKIRKIIEAGSSYYKIRVQAGDKTLLTPKDFENIQAVVKALRESPATAGYFADDDELSPVRRYYQLKFAANFEGVGYRNMADLLVVDYEQKKVWPIDLKTSIGCAEWDFEQNFKKWHYYIQARLYWRIIRANMNKDDYFKDFSLEDYRFIICNPKTLIPLVWEFPLTKAMGTLVTDDGKEIRDPFEIGKELQGYLNLRPLVPNGINKDGINIINCLKLKQ
jgi:hypothetical protein